MGKPHNIRILSQRQGMVLEAMCHIRRQFVKTRTYHACQVRNDVIPEMQVGPFPKLLLSPNQDDWSVHPIQAYWVCEQKEDEERQGKKLQTSTTQYGET